MIRTTAIRDAWHPQTREDRDAILRELQAVLASPHFCNSKRYPALLQYIVENTLAGKSELLKERTLGVEVFDRPPSYDTNTDTVVRYTAGEVRKRLSLYYHELDRKPAIQISLPAGSYIPEFTQTLDEPKEPARQNAAHIPRQDGRDPAGLSVVDGGGPWAGEVDLRASGLVVVPARETEARAAATQRRGWLGIAVLIAVVVLAGFGWRYRAAHLSAPLDQFWAPVMRVIMPPASMRFAMSGRIK